MKFIAHKINKKIIIIVTFDVILKVIKINHQLKILLMFNEKYRILKRVN